MDSRRILYFLGLCITSRTLITWLSYKYPQMVKPYTWLGLLPVIGWLYIYFVSGRDTGPEVFGGKIWWNELRIPHAMLWSLFVLYSQKDKSYAWVPLALDTVMGLAAWLNMVFSSSSYLR